MDDLSGSGRRLALLIATSRYEDPGLRRLRAPGADVRALEAVLKDPAVGGFSVTTVLDPRVDEFERSLAEFVRSGGPGDLMLLYLACHAVIDAQGRLFYAASNTVRSIPAGTAMGASRLNGQLAECLARQVVLLDCCHSGEYPVQLLAPLSGRNKIVLTASESTEYTFEGDRVHGDGARPYFTRALVDGLTGGRADADRDGLVTTDELFEFIRHQARAQESTQHPKRWVVGGQGPLVVARAGRAAAVSAPPSRPSSAPPSSSSSQVPAWGSAAAPQPPPAMPGVLTPLDVLHSRFRPTKLRSGYDQDEVDDFLDRAEAELRWRHDRLTGSRAERPGPALTPGDVSAVRFTTTKFREGYDQSEVDAFLDQVVSSLRALGELLRID